MMSGKTRTSMSKYKLHNIKIYQSVFNGYRTVTAFGSSKHRFLIEWPEAERGGWPIQIGVCETEIVNRQMVVKDTLLWELPSQRLIRQELLNDSLVEKQSFSLVRYSVGFEPKSADPEEPECSWELPRIFSMTLDMEKGILSFRTEGRGFDVAFKDDLKGKALHLAFFAKKKPNFNVTVWELVPEVIRS